MHNAAILLFFFFFFCTTLIRGNIAQEHICRAVKCSHGSPEIKFPFIIQRHQPQNCGFPGFDLTCDESNTTATTTTTTTIKFPSFRHLIVTSISYVDKRLNLADPDNCVHEVFLNLNLSKKPFRYYHSLKKYKYLNCSNRLDSAPEIPCLSSSRFHVYTVEDSSMDRHYSSCKAVKTVEIPFGFNPYLSDNSFGLALTWDMDWKENKGGVGLSVNNMTQALSIISILIIFVMAAALGFFVKIRHSKRNIESEDQQQLL